MTEQLTKREKREEKLTLSKEMQAQAKERRAEERERQRNELFMANSSAEYLVETL